MTTPTPPPGWYPDPLGPPGQRYFNGTDWTNYRAAPGAVPPPAQSSKGKTALIAVGATVGALVVLLLLVLVSPAEVAGHQISLK